MIREQNNFEQDNLTGKNHEGKNANSPVRVLTATSIMADNIENFKGEKLGSIKDIMINLRDGRIEYVIMQSGGFLGIGDKLFAVPFEALQLDPEKEVFLLNRDEAYIKNAPGFDQDHWPETNNHYSDVDTYWREEREPITATTATDTSFNERTGGTTTTGSVDPTDFTNSGGSTRIQI